MYSAPATKKHISLLKPAFIVGVFLLAMLDSKTALAQCRESDCGDGFYVCNGGNMCCRDGGGCPSYECASVPGGTCWSSIHGNNYTCFCRVRDCSASGWVTRYYSCPPCRTINIYCWQEPCNCRTVTTTCAVSYRTCSTCTRTIRRCLPYPMSYVCWNETQSYTCNCRDVCIAWNTERRCSTCTECETYTLCSTCSERVYVENCVHIDTQEEYVARGECYYCTPGGGGGGGGTTEPTCSTNPTAPTLNTPANNATINKLYNMDINFSWNEPSSWGANCNTGRTYRLLVDDENTFTNPRVTSLALPASDTAETVAVPGADTYFWRVQACNSNGCTNSALRSFNVTCGSVPGAASNPTPADSAEEVFIPVQLSWDAPADWGVACGGSNTNTYKVFAKVKNNPTCENPGSSYSEICSGSAASCSDSLLNVRNTSYCWYVETSNGTYSTPSATTGSEVWEFTTEDPIGFQNWITVLGGDFYSGDYSAELPNVSAQVTPWSPVHTVYEVGGIPVSMITSNATTFTHDNTAGGYTPQSESGLYATSANYSTTWPPNYEGTPPASAVELPLGSDSCSQIFTGSNKLEPFEVYEVDVACIEDAINAVEGFSNGYELDSEGYAVIFVTGSGDLDITGEFTTDNDDYRVVFVTGPDVTINIDRTVGLSGDPALDSEAQIEAAFIVTGSMEFTGVSTEPAGDPLLDPDTTIVVEGPIVAKNISFDRNLGRNNQFPSEIVKYNSGYIYNLTEEERNTLKSNGSGLFVIDVDWLKEE